MGWIVALALPFMLCLAIAGAETPRNCGAPASLRDEWAVAAPEKESLNPTLICGLGPQFEALKEAKAHGIVIARHGRLVCEQYFAGRDQRLGLSLGDVNFDAGMKHDIHSISKSVTSLLVGIAVDRGLIDFDAPVFSFFREYDDLRTPEKDRITLGHLLTMSSGLAWDESSVSYSDPSNTYLADERGASLRPLCPGAAACGPTGHPLQLQQRQRRFAWDYTTQDLGQAARRVCEGSPL